VRKRGGGRRKRERRKVRIGEGVEERLRRREKEREREEGQKREERRGSTGIEEEMSSKVEKAAERREGMSPVQKDPTEQWITVIILVTCTTHL